MIIIIVFVIFTLLLFTENNEYVKSNIIISNQSDFNILTLRILCQRNNSTFIYIIILHKSIKDLTNNDY